MANGVKYRIIESGKGQFFIQQTFDDLFWDTQSLYDKDYKTKSQFGSEKEARKALETIKQQRRDAQVKRIVYQE